MTNEIGFEEAIRHYDRENDRKQALESKASYILGIVSLIMTILFTLLIDIILTKNISYNLQCFNLIVILIIILLILILGLVNFLCIRVLKIKDIFYPINTTEPNELRTFLAAEDNILKEELFTNYLSNIFINNAKNNAKAEDLSKAFILIEICAGILIFLALILVVFK